MSFPIQPDGGFCYLVKMRSSLNARFTTAKSSRIGESNI